MVEKIYTMKLNLKVPYYKTEFEKRLERILKKHEITLSDPHFEEQDSLSEVNISRDAEVDKKFGIIYKRWIQNLEQALTSHKQPTGINTEVIDLYIPKKDGGSYFFELNPEKREMTDHMVEFDMKDLVPTYKGLLDDEHTWEKDGSQKHSKITKCEFLLELDDILTCYKKGRKK